MEGAMAMHAQYVIPGGGLVITYATKGHGATSQFLPCRLRDAADVIGSEFADTSNNEFEWVAHVVHTWNTNGGPGGDVVTIPDGAGGTFILYWTTRQKLEYPA